MSQNMREAAAKSAQAKGQKGKYKLSFRKKRDNEQFEIADKVNEVLRQENFVLDIEGEHGSTSILFRPLSVIERAVINQSLFSKSAATAMYKMVQKGISEKEAQEQMFNSMSEKELDEMMDSVKSLKRRVDAVHQAIVEPVGYSKEEVEQWDEEIINFAYEGVMGAADDESVADNFSDMD